MKWAALLALLGLWVGKGEGSQRPEAPLFVDPPSVIFDSENPFASATLDADSIPHDIRGPAKAPPRTVTLDDYTDPQLADEIAPNPHLSPLYGEDVPEETYQVGGLPEFLESDGDAQARHPEIHARMGVADRARLLKQGVIRGMAAKELSRSNGPHRVSTPTGQPIRVMVQSRRGESLPPPDLPGSDKAHPDYDFDAMPTLVQEQARQAREYYPKLDDEMEGTTPESDQLWLASLRNKNHKSQADDPFAGDDPMTAAEKRVHQKDVVVSDDDTFRFKEASTPRSTSGRSFVDWDSYKGVGSRLHTAPVAVHSDFQDQFNRPAQPNFDWSIPQDRVEAPPTPTFTQAPPRFLQQERSSTETNTLGSRTANQKNPALLEVGGRASVEVATFGHPRQSAVKHAIRKRQPGSLVELGAKAHATARVGRTSSLPLPWPSRFHHQVKTGLTGIRMPVPLTHNEANPDYDQFNKY